MLHVQGYDLATREPSRGQLPLGGPRIASIDLRVDDHEKPIQELSRILELKVRKPK